MCVHIVYLANICQPELDLSQRQQSQNLAEVHFDSHPHSDDGPWCCCRLASGDLEGRVVLWDVTGGAPEAALDDPAQVLAVQ